MSVQTSQVGVIENGKLFLNKQSPFLKWSQRFLFASPRKKHCEDSFKLIGLNEFKAVPKTMDMLITDMLKSFAQEKKLSESYRKSKRIYNVGARYLLCVLAGKDPLTCARGTENWRNIKMLLKKNWNYEELQHNLRSTVMAVIAKWLNADENNTKNYLDSVLEAVTTKQGGNKEKSLDVFTFELIQSKFKSKNGTYPKLEALSKALDEYQKYLQMKKNSIAKAREHIQSDNKTNYIEESKPKKTKSKKVVDRAPSPIEEVIEHVAPEKVKTPEIIEPKPKTRKFKMTIKMKPKEEVIDDVYGVEEKVVDEPTPAPEIIEEPVVLEEHTQGDKPKRGYEFYYVNGERRERKKRKTKTMPKPKKATTKKALPINALIDDETN